jgi:hypothetical protein
MDPMADVLGRPWTQVDNWVNYGLGKGGFVDTADYSNCPYSVGVSEDILCAAAKTGSGFNSPILTLLNYIRNIFGAAPMTKTDEFKICVPDIDNIMTIAPENITIGNWTGDLTNGNVFDNIRVNGGTPPAPTMVPVAGTIPLAELTCNGDFFILPGQPMQMSIGMGKIHDHVNAGFKMISEIEQCRATTVFGHALDIGEINYRYILADPAWMLYYLTTTTAEYEADRAPMTDFVDRLFKERPGTYKVVLPQGCEKADFVTGRCSFSFLGLSNITGITNVIRVQIDRCASKPFGLPSIKFDCQGDGCSVLLNPIPCTTEGAVGGDCPPMTKCYNAANLVGSYNVFGELEEITDICATSTMWYTFINKIIRDNLNTAVPSSKADLLYCWFREETVQANSEIYEPAVKDPATMKSIINHLIPFCDVTAGTCVQTDLPDVSASPSLVPSAIILVLGLFLSGRRGLAFIAVVLAVMSVANAQIYNFRSVSMPTQADIMSNIQSYQIQLAFDVDGYFQQSSDWCTNGWFVGHFVEEGGCYNCDGDYNSIRIEFKPSSCTNLEATYNESSPFTAIAQFKTQYICVPKVMYMMELKYSYNGWENNGIWFDNEQQKIELNAEQNQVGPALQAFTVNASTVDVTSQSRAIEIHIEVAEENCTVNQFDVRFSSCEWFYTDDAYNGDYCEDYWLNNVNWQQNVVGNVVTLDITVVIGQGTKPGKIYMLLDVSDGMNDKIIYPCDLTPSYITVVDATPDVQYPYLNSFVQTSSQVLKTSPFFIANIDVQDNVALKYGSIEWCMINATSYEEYNCQRMSIDSYYLNNQGTNTKDHWVGTLNVSMDGTDCQYGCSYWSCGYYVASRFSLSDEAGNEVYADLCDNYESRHFGALQGLKFGWDLANCPYYDPVPEDYCSSDAFGNFFMQLIDNEPFDKNAL